STRVTQVTATVTRCLLPELLRSYRDHGFRPFESTPTFAHAYSTEKVTKCSNKMMVCYWLFVVASAFIVLPEPESFGSHVLRFLLDYRMLTVLSFYCIRFCKFALCSSFALIPCFIHTYTRKRISFRHMYIDTYVAIRIHFTHPKLLQLTVHCVVAFVFVHR
ncbi:hypothetical protein P879_11640, partial [Paragonimus westermani]